MLKKVKNRINVLGLFWLTALVLVTIVASCGGNANPAAPTGSGRVVPGARLFALPPDDVITLKVPAPDLQSPSNDSETQGLTPTVVINNPKPSFVSNVDLTFDFQFYKVLDGGGMSMVGTTRSVASTAGSTSTSYTVPDGELEQTSTFMWRSRARIGDEHGPWSAAWTFRTLTVTTVDPPTPLSPPNGSDVTTSNPELIVTNGAVSANAGAVAVEFQINDGPDPAGGPIFPISLGAGGTTTGVFEDPLVLNTLFSWRARQTNGTITSDWSETFTFTTTSGGPSGPDGPRPPDPPPGGQLPLPNMATVVAQLGDAFPDLLEDSCQIPEFGGTPGNWGFLDLVADTLRQTDPRWGYNGRRGNTSDPSEDVVDYHWGAGPSEGSTDVYIIKVIGLYCRPNPGTSWIDLTQDTEDAGTVGAWTGRGRF